jgi:hypothetical protein
VWFELNTNKPFYGHAKNAQKPVLPITKLMKSSRNITPRSPCIRF